MLRIYIYFRHVLIADGMVLGAAFWVSFHLDVIST